MLNVSFSLLWSFSFFFFLFYTLFIFSLLIYLLPYLKDSMSLYNFKKNINFDYLNGLDFLSFFLSFFILFFLTFYFWVSPSFTIWFGNLFYSSFQFKIYFFIFFFFIFYFLTFLSSTYFTSKEIYDFSIVLINFFYWLLLLFFSNNLFVFIFFIEILSTLIFLILVASTFSSTFFYNNLSLNLNYYFSNNLPVFYLQTLIFFFWISFVSSINLFLFLILFYIKLLTFDWYFFEYIFLYFLIRNETKDFFFIILIWFNLLFSIFLKCGLVPFYFWKPIFFKGLPFHVLNFYIVIFYFFFFIYLIFFFLTYMNEIFFFSVYINILILLIGFFFFFFIICEAFYIKTFLALSSILNTLFVFLALVSLNFTDFFFFL